MTVELTVLGVTQRRTQSVRIWKDDDDWQVDGGVWLPYYLDEVELGIRVCDYLNGPGEEQMLDDMMYSTPVAHEDDSYSYNTNRVVCQNTWPS